MLFFYINDLLAHHFLRDCSFEKQVFLRDQFDVTIGSQEKYHMASASKKPSIGAVWFNAIRPWSYPASISPVVLGTALVSFSGHAIRWPLFFLTLFGIMCFQSAANLFNDCFDHRRGLDVSANPSSGSVVRGWISEKQAFIAAMGFFSAGVACGLILTAVVGWVIFILGLAGALLVAGYTGPRFCIKYAGLGDAAVFLGFGLLPTLGAWWVQTQRFAWDPLVWSIPVVSLTVAILHANNWRDIPTDPLRQCRTMARALGFSGSQLYYRILLLLPFAAVAVFVAEHLGGLGMVAAPATLLLAFAVFPLALSLAKLKVSASNADGLVGLDGKTAQVQLAFGLLISLAFFLAPVLPWRV